MITKIDTRLATEKSKWASGFINEHIDLDGADWRLAWNVTCDTVQEVAWESTWSHVWDATRKAIAEIE